MKPKRFLLMLLTLLMGASMWAEDGIVGDMKWEYDEDTRTLTFSSVDPYSDPVAMPEYDHDYDRPWYTFIIRDIVLSVKFINISSISDNALFYGEGITSVDIPNTVTSIGSSAFEHCKSLKSVTLPNSITRIGDHAFSRCTSLTSINIPDGVQTLWATFRDCSSLESIFIPESVRVLRNSVFEGCTGLKSIAVEAETPPTTGLWCFEGVDKSIPVYVPNSAMDAYKSADGWKDFTNFQELYITGTQGDLKWDFYQETKLLTFSSVDPDSEPVEMPDYYNDETPWIELTTQALSVKFVNISHIGDYALYSLPSLITSIDIPNTVTSIGNSAFSGCTSLESLTLPNSVTSIGQRAFASCRKLTSIRIPNGVTRLPDETFVHCASLKSVTIPASVTELGRYVLSSCKALTSIFVEAETPPAVEAYSFFTVDKSIPLHVPYGKGEAYRRADGWKEFTNIIERMSDVNAIQHVGADGTGNGAIYNLNGIRLNKLQKGINIVGGRKVVK